MSANAPIGMILVAACLVSACSDSLAVSGAGNPSKSGALNVSQGGPQDIAQFRALVQQGKVPASETLDPVGFFAEHAVDLPPADCGRDLCVHPMLAVAPRFDGGNWTMAFLAMNTPLDPATLPRPPLHLVMAIETSPEMLDKQAWLRDGLAGIVGTMREGDRLSLVAFDERAHSFIVGAAPDPRLFGEWMAQTFDSYPSEESFGALYDGLAAADRAIDSLATFEGAHRVLLVTTGRATRGVSDPERIALLGEGLARRGVAIHVVGATDVYDATVPAALGSLGAGSYAYAQDGEIVEVLGLVGETTLFPLATDFRVSITPAPGYRIGRIYGARRAWAHPGLAVLDLPAVFIGRREGSMDTDGGRRGGGGGLFVELIADPDSGVPASSPAYRIEASWNEASGAASTAEEVMNPLSPAATPSGTDPFFSEADYGKPFMMLNMYLALRATTELYEGGDCARAMGVAEMMAPSVQAWQQRYADPDIAADQDLLLLLGQNVARECTARGPIKPIQPTGGDAGCFFI